jgi:hypothetical protein
VLCGNGFVIIFLMGFIYLVATCFFCMVACDSVFCCCYVVFVATVLNGLKFVAVLPNGLSAYCVRVCAGLCAGLRVGLGLGLGFGHLKTIGALYG